MFAAACAQRQTEAREQELRSFVAKQSVFRIHCVVAFAMIVIVLQLFGSSKLDRGAAAIFVAAAMYVVGASTRSIANAIVGSDRQTRNTQLAYWNAPDHRPK